MKIVERNKWSGFAEKDVMQQNFFRLRILPQIDSIYRNMGIWNCLKGNELEYD